MQKFLAETDYIDYNAQIIKEKVAELFADEMQDVKKAELAYLFVRDNIAHSFDCNATVITSKASDVLKYKTGICHAKANLLAALLRSQNIPVGFCFERLTLSEDDSIGYCVHGYNAVYVSGRWIKLDARGNKEGVNAEFSIDQPCLAYSPREEFEEYFFPGIYANPHTEAMVMLEHAKSLQDILDHFPDFVSAVPDIPE